MEILKRTLNFCIQVVYKREKEKIKMRKRGSYGKTWNLGNIAKPFSLQLSMELADAHEYHNVFCCPILRSHCTITNPPMRLDCGHAVSKDAVLKLSQSGRLKCPYCPREMDPKSPQELFFWCHNSQPIDYSSNPAIVRRMSDQTDGLSRDVRGLYPMWLTCATFSSRLLVTLQRAVFRGLYIARVSFWSAAPRSACDVWGWFRHARCSDLVITPNGPNRILTRPNAFSKVPQRPEVRCFVTPCSLQHNRLPFYFPFQTRNLYFNTNKYVNYRVILSLSNRI